MEINLGIWGKLKKPIMILAPMEDVTDTVFRQIILEIGRPDLMFTEFTSAEGICSPGRKFVAQRLKFHENEKPLIAQIWGKSPDAHYKAAKWIKALGFDDVDINMGCPVRKITKQGCCSALIDNPNLAVEIIEASKEGSGSMPVSVKTRIGFKKKKTLEWSETLLKTGIAALTVHGRLAKDMSKKPADWDEIGKVVDLRNNLNISTLIIGNGDVRTMEDAQAKIDRYKVDGIMIGRGVFENPWIFDPSIDLSTMTVDNKIQLLLKHLHLFDNTWGTKKNFAIMKKFFKVYVSEFTGAAELRAALYDCEDSEEAIELLKRLRDGELNELVGDTGLEPVTPTVSL